VSAQDRGVTLTDGDARRVLAQLDRGVLDALPAAARDVLRTQALRALVRPTVDGVAEIVEVYMADGHRHVRVLCPFCPPRRGGQLRTHVHGWPLGDGDDAPGHRVAHCGATTSIGYFIPAPSVTT
jgi:hypothetical protein